MSTQEKTSNMSQILDIKVKALLPLVLALSVSAGPALAWGDGDCPFSKKGINQDASSEKVEKTESSNQ